MGENFDIHSFVDTVMKQDAVKLQKFFEPEAVIVWANTNEKFSVDEYIRANCEYPGDWQGTLEDYDFVDRGTKTLIFIVSVHTDEKIIARTVSFINFASPDCELISRLTEYWGDIGEPPQWRKDKNIGLEYKKNSKLWHN